MKSSYKIGIVILLLLFIIWIKHSKYSRFNTNQVKSCESGVCETYNVHNEHNDQQDAADLLSQITTRIEKMINHLENKYVKQSGFDPEESTTENYTTTVYIQERINQLVYNYNDDRVYEISPLNKENVTSYSENKRTLILCLREKIADVNGQHQLHDINTMMFVVLHEMAHIMNDKWGHTQDSNFWQLFKFLLDNAVEIDLYEPVNYKIEPIVYCGLKLTYNPYFDSI